MADPLELVTKLMALALNNPNAEEARSAALKAVQLIRQHGFTLTPARTATPQTATTGHDWQDLQDTIRRQSSVDYWNRASYQYWGYDPPQPFKSPGEK